MDLGIRNGFFYRNMHLKWFSFYKNGFLQIHEWKSTNAKAQMPKFIYSEKATKFKNWFRWVFFGCQPSLLKSVQSSIIHNSRLEKIWSMGWKKKTEVSILTQKFAIGVMPCAAYSLKRLFSLVFLWFQQPKLTKDDPERRLEFGESIIGLIERKGVQAVVGNLLTSDQSTIQLGAGPVGRTMVNHNMTF